MDNAVVVKTNNVDSSGLLASLGALSLKNQFSLILGLTALAGLVFGLAAWNNHGDYKVLYANLSDKDGGAIIAQLSQMNVPYRHADGGAAILVPSAKVHDVRLKLASAGLPKGSVVGFELMDGARFGQTQFQERLTFQRGLEGELTRSITAMPAVQGARVHLALPNQNGFFREQQKPSASILLSLHPGRTLDRAQVAGIVHLVASSVPEMNPKAVSVLDQTGALLSDAPDSGNSAGLDSNQLQYVGQIEAGYNKRIFELLEPVVGRANLRSSVTAEVDFTQSEATSEEFKPNQGAQANATVRSQQTTDMSGASAALPAGVPGAASNQPPVPATAAITGATKPLQAGQGGGGAGTSRREAVTNFEVDKTVRVTRAATGVVKRVNAAVVVNHRVLTDARGKTSQEPLSAEEIEKLSALVRESIGFKPERGDSVKVINAPFKIEPVDNSVVPFWRQPGVQDMVRGVVAPAGLALLAVLVFFGMVKPALQALLKPTPGSRLNAAVNDAQGLPGGFGPAGAPFALAPPNMGAQLEQARQFTKDNPAATANIVHSWVSGSST
ncbi:MAG: flagellar M-ring protein FliF [Burkholderiales bacterium]|jgi:flagellar M-ring protein FliF|nr:flagellar M-ring protein FliF [Burkholderiales bacterium]